MCSNGNDIKMCQSTLLVQPNSENPSFNEHYSKCPLIGQVGFTRLYSQHVHKSSINDSKMYQCVNRGDESPFIKPNSNSLDHDGELAVKKDDDGWLKLVTKPCPGLDNAGQRRCLGHRPDQCVHAASPGTLIEILIILFFHVRI